jgi:hypothetical protein
VVPTGYHGNIHMIRVIPWKPHEYHEFASFMLFLEE